MSMRERERSGERERETERKRGREREGERERERASSWMRLFFTQMSLHVNHKCEYKLIY